MSKNPFRREPPQDRFEAFTQRARKVLVLAQDEAQLLGHNYLGTEHLLLSLLRVEDGVAAHVLRGAGVAQADVRARIMSIIGKGESMPVGEMGLTPRAKRVIELAVDEARLLNDHQVGTEHLLLGLIREGEGIAAGILSELGLSLAEARRGALEIRGVSSGQAGQSSSFGPDLRADLLTGGARKVLQLSQEEAKRFNHNYIGTEHLLLGLVREGDGVAARVLNNLGIALEKVRSAVEFVIGRGDVRVRGEIGLTPRAKRVIELAVDEAKLLGHDYIDTEHLLLGLVREGEGIAAGVLESLGVSLEKVRAQVIEVLKNGTDLALAPASPEVEETELPTETSTSDTDSVRTIIVTYTANLRNADDPPMIQLDISYEPSHRVRQTPDIFSPTVFEVLQQAYIEAKSLNHAHIGTEHLLLAMLAVPTGIAYQVLLELHVGRDKTQQAVEAVVARGNSGSQDPLNLTPGATHALSVALDEAAYLSRYFERERVETEHLLLGLVHDGQEVAASVLESLGLSIKAVRLKVLEVLGRSG